MAAKYKPAPEKRIPMPGNQADWPEEGREIDPLSGYENRLVADGDLVPVDDDIKPNDKPAASARSADGSNGGNSE